MTIKNISRKLFRLTAAFVIGGLLSSNYFSIFNSQFSIGSPAYAAPSYSIGFTADKAQAARGETVNYNLTVTNNGDANLTNIFVYTGNHPANATYVSGSGKATKGSTNINVPDDWYNDAAGSNFGTLTPSQAFTFTWSATVNSDAPFGSTQTLNLGIKTNELPNPQGYAPSFTVAQNAATSSLCAGKTADKSSASVGDVVTFTIKVCNDGDIDQTNVLVYDRLPKELTYKAGTSSLNARGANIAVNDSWIGTSSTDGNGINLGTIKSGETFTITYQATLNSNASNGQTIQNVAQVKSDQKPNYIQCPVYLTANVPATTGSPVCSLTKKIRLPNGNEVGSVDSGTHIYAPGEQIVYRLFITNTGNGDANPVGISDLLPPYLYWVSGDGGYAQGPNKVNFDLGTLKAGESRTLTYTVQVRSTIPSGQATQQNNATASFPNNLSCSASSTLVIGKPGAVLAATTSLPQTGSVPMSVLGALGLTGSGLILRLRKVKRFKYWG